MDFNIIQPAPTGESQWAKDMHRNGERLHLYDPKPKPIPSSKLREAIEFTAGAISVSILGGLFLWGLYTIVMREINRPAMPHSFIENCQDVRSGKVICDVRVEWY